MRNIHTKELFVVKGKTSHSCESVTYFNLDTHIIKENCNFKFCFNKRDITSTIFDGGNVIVLANWPNGKDIICNVNNAILVIIPSDLYVLVNSSILCNCGIEADNHYLLELIAACDNRNSKLIMYFTINMAFAHYLDAPPNLTVSFPLIRDRTIYEQTLPLNLCISGFDKSLLHMSTNLKDFIKGYAREKEIFDLKERHVSAILNTSKNFFSNNYIVDTFVFASSIISLISTTLII